MGVLTLEFLIAYFIGMILTRSNNWKNELFEFIKREPWNVFFFDAVCMDYHMYNAFG